MKYSISRHGDLVISASQQERNEIKARMDEADFNSDDTMYEILEPLFCNSDLQFCFPEEIGALTNAPILCRRNDDDSIDEAWCFMDYQVRSVQQDLAEDGQAIFQKG